MTEEMMTGVPQPTLRRLPSYLALLKRLETEGIDRVSCPMIATELGLDPTQVRKDIAATGIEGRAKVGYQLAELVRAIERFLGWDNVTCAFLAGAGHLGTALMGYEGFRGYGLSIVAAFDSDPAKIGTRICGKEVFPIERLPELAMRMHIHVGVLTVPAERAQAVAEMMATGGIRAILNFAPAALRLPPPMIIENVNLASNLAVLSSKLAASLRATGDSEITG